MQVAHHPLLPPAPFLMLGGPAEVPKSPKPALLVRAEKLLNKFIERKTPVPEQLPNPFIEAQIKFDEMQRDLMLTKDELAQQKEENARLNNAVVEADSEIALLKAEHDEAFSKAVAHHSVVLAAKDE